MANPFEIKKYMELISSDEYIKEKEEYLKMKKELERQDALIFKKFKKKIGKILSALKVQTRILSVQNANTKKFYANAQLLDWIIFPALLITYICRKINCWALTNGPGGFI